MTSQQALSSWLIQRAAARAAEKASLETPPETCVPKEREAPTFEIARSPVVIDEFLWSSLFASPDQDDRTEPVFELIQGSGPQTELPIPGGFHEASVLDRLIESRRMFSGLVLSIGVSQADEHMGSLEAFLKGLLRPADFVCRRAADELVLLCPAESGSEAQAYLSLLSERLWDLQLRSLSASSNLFSVGGVGVKRESLGDAVALANERMCQTRRSRKTVAMPLPSQRRRAV